MINWYKEGFIFNSRETKLPAEYDSRVKAMEVHEKPTEEYSDIGGLDKQIQELVEAVVLPMTHKEKFEAIGILSPKGVLFAWTTWYRENIIGSNLCKTDRCCVFLKSVAPQFVQML